jgi:hypothetical protein
LFDMDGPLLADISGTNAPRRNALHGIGSGCPSWPRRSALEGGLTGHNQRACTPQADAHATVASRSLTCERSPADPESTTEKQP